MKALITLGCESHVQFDFCFCKGVENIILDLEKIEHTDNYFDMIKYLDNTVKIFDSPCNKAHIISNAIYKMYEFEYIDDELYKILKYFYEMHRRCGLIMAVKVKK